jgi:peptide/nickel transport system substrate-binding protein
MRRSIGIVAAGAVAAIILASCASADDEAEGGGDDGDDDEGGGTAQLTILAEDIPAGLDYDGPSAAIPTSQTGMVNLMEPLVYYKAANANDSGVGLLDFGTDPENFEGRLAESFSYDEASLTWTFNLREGVVGCDGATFDADDVIYTFARAKSVSGASPIGWFLGNVASIDGFTVDVFGEDPAAKELGDEVTKVDDYTVTIRQAAPNKLFLPVLTIFGMGIFDKELMEENATEDDPWSHEYANNENVPSFGPYCLDRWEKSSEFVVTVNPDYYRGPAAIESVVYRKVPQSANRLAAVRGGEAQLVERLTPREIDSLDGVDRVTVSSVQGNENLFVHMNYANPPFDDVRVRQAVAYAIDYDALIENGYFGQATKWEGQIPSTYPGFSVAGTQYEYDPDRARELLEEAGYVDDGTLTLSYVAEKEATLGPIVTQIRADLAEVGITVQLDPLPQTQYGDRQLVKKDLPFAVNDQEKPIGVDAGYALLLFFVSADKGGLNNMVNYSSPVVDGLFSEIINEADEQVRNEKLAEAQEQLQEDVAWAPVVEYRTQWAHSSDLQGLVWHPDNSIRWYDLS